MTQDEAIPLNSDSATRAGHVAIIGLPNAGKSSLLNRLMDTKLSIVSPLAQTTREKVVGIDTRDGVQMIFMDTPGLVTPAYLLHHAMAGIIEQTIGDADVVVLLLDGTRPPPELDSEVSATLAAAGSRLIVAINKADLAAETQVLELRRWATEWAGGDPLILSAESGEGVEALRTRIAGLLPPSPLLYPEDDISTQSLRFFTAELIREAVFELYQEEIPFSVATRVEEFRESADPIFIRAVVYVERQSQKGILVGQGGRAIRELGTRSRGKIEEFLQAHVYLDLWVKVLPKWRKSALELQRLGFSVPDLETNRA